MREGLTIKIERKKWQSVIEQLKVLGIGIFVIVLCAAMIYFYTHALFVFSTEILFPEVPDDVVLLTTENVDQEISATLNSFIYLQMTGDEKASELTAGDTKRLVTNNLSDVKGTVDHMESKILYSSPKFAQATSDVLMTVGGRADKQTFLFTLYHSDGWKIIDVEQVATVLQDGVHKEFTEQQIIYDYLETIANGEWEKQLDYLAGVAYQSAVSSYRHLPELHSEIETITMKPILEEYAQALVEVSYTVQNDFQKQQITTLFELQNLKGAWKITRIYPISNGDV